MEGAQEVADVPVARVQSRGQVTVPQEIREACGITSGADLYFLQTGPHAFECRVLPAREPLATMFDRFSSSGVAPDLTRLREEMGDAMAQEQMRECSEELAGA
jgi:bifunctional DNA-binding transcriptional regulator/antitoxin component of YhaV-PrlF toxin-antitoxin module